MRNKILLLVILLVAFLVRFWNLQSFPVSLSHDEVAIGYNAWSILQTGKDEYGNFLPVLFRSFDDFKLPGYIYSTVLSEKIFGLNEFAVRFPSAFLGVLTVLALYFLVQEITLYYIKPKENSLFTYLPLTTAGFLAISPWHINFSRAAFESNGSVFFIVIAVFFLFYSIRKKNFIVFSAISAGCAIYFYYTARILLPLISIIFFLTYRDIFLKNKKWIVIFYVVLGVTLLPIIPSMFSSGLSRVNQVSIFNDKTLTNPYSEQVVRDNNNIISKLIYNRRIAYFQQFSDNYLRNFAPDFYFVSGTGPMGLLYLWELPFFLFGIYLIARAKEKWKWIILAWFFTVPLVGGLTTGQPNALRTLANAPMASLFSAMGILGFFYTIKHTKIQKFMSILIAIIIIFFFVRFMGLYFRYYPNYNALSWGDGHKQMVSVITQKKSLYDHIYITGEYWRPYIYVLFYSNYPPAIYQQNGAKEHFDRFYFGQASWDRGNGLNLSTQDLSKIIKQKTLFVLSQKDYKSQINLILSNKFFYKLKLVQVIEGIYTKEPFFIVELE